VAGLEGVEQRRIVQLLHELALGCCKLVLASPVGEAVEIKPLAA